MKMRILFIIVAVFCLDFNSWAQCGLNEEEFVLTINPNTSSEDVFWTIEGTGHEIYNYGFQLENGSIYTESFCLPYGQYNFVIDQMNGSTWGGTYSLVNSTGQNVAGGLGLNSNNPALFSSALGIHPCQDIEGTVSYNLPPDVTFTQLEYGDTLELCYDINLDVELEFPDNNTNYNQSADNVTYLWEVHNNAGASDGQTSDQSTAYFTFEDHVTYSISLTVTDTNDCSFEYEFFVKNTSPNSFVNVWVEEDTICVGDFTNVHTSHFNNSFPLSVDEPNPIFLDDVVGGQYASTINISQFTPGEVLTPGCITRVCADMEHTWAGDLTIFLELPNGEQIDFVPDLNGTGSGNGFGNVDMGIPGPGTAPGTPFQYCWTPTATQTMHDIAPTTVFAETIINGDGTYTNDYAANDDNGNGWDNAIGSPINGDWTFNIIDTWGGDDGYIFGWNFELCVSPQVVYVDSFWVGNPDSLFVTNADADSTTRQIQGVTAPDGVMNIEYHLVDNYGCEWVDDIDIVTWPIPVVTSAGDDVVMCDSVATLSVSDSNTAEPGTWTYVAPPGGPQNVIFDPSPNLAQTNVIVPELGEYTFIYTSSCGAEVYQTINFESEAPTLNVNPSQECLFTVNLGASNTQNGHWTVTTPEGETAVIADPSAFNTTAEVSNYGTYTFTFTYDFCVASFSQEVEILSVDPVIQPMDDYIICDLTINLAATVPGLPEQWSVTGPGIVTFTNFEGLVTEATVSEYGDYTFYFDGCGGRDSIDITFVKNAPTINAPTYVTCGTEALVEVLFYGDEPGTWSYTAGTDEVITLNEIDDNNLSVSSDSYGDVDLTYTVCDTSTTVNVVFMCELQVPNVFTPNNDGINNEFSINRLTTQFYDKSRLIVYDRWGVEVYTNGRYGLEGSWWNGKKTKNGEDLPAGIYYYELLLHNKVNDLDEVYKGSVNIFR